MQKIIKGRHIEVTQALKDWVEKKLEKISKKFDVIHKVDVELEYLNGQPEAKNECEITVFADHVIFRGVARNDDMYVAIDKAIEKIERQIERYKGKNYVSENKRAHLKPNQAVVESSESTEREIVKRKKFQIRELDVRDAIDQMEYLGHDFFVFVKNNDKAVSILYRRKDGKLGLIETDIFVS